MIVRVMNAAVSEAEHEATEQALIIMDKAAEYAPVSDGSRQRTRVYAGYLRDSRYVERSRKTSNGFSVRAGFHANYALAAHESPLVGVDTGGPKFLERAYEELAPKAVSTIRRKTAGGIRSVIRK